MNNRILALASTIILCILAGCSSTLWDELPEPVATFVDKYFPATEISEAQTTADGFTVDIKSGPAMTFGAAPDYPWSDINGRGATLPVMLVTDQLPPVVTDYLREMEMTAGVYRIRRTWRVYRVDLLDDYLTYDIQTAAITYPEARR